jgi:hypothetical protein
MFFGGMKKGLTGQLLVVLKDHSPMRCGLWPGLGGQIDKRDHTMKRSRDADDGRRKEYRAVAGVEKGKTVGEKGKRVGG